MSSGAIDFVALARAKGKGKGKGKGTSAKEAKPSPVVDEPEVERPSASPRRHAPGDTSSAAKTKGGRKVGGKSAKTEDKVYAETAGDVDAIATATGKGAAAAAAAATETADEFKPASMRQSLLYSFANMLSQFLAAAASVWPKDAVIAGWNATFNATISAADDKARETFFRHLINGFHDAFKEHYSDIAGEDPALFDDERNEWLAAVRAKAKFAEAHPQIRAQVWQYASFLARMSNMYAMYAKCPDGLLGHIHKLALQLGGRLQRGEMLLADLNPMTLGQHLMKVLTPDELNKFGTSMLSEGNIEGSLSLLQNMVSMLGGSGSGMSAKDIMAMAGVAEA